MTIGAVGGVHAVEVAHGLSARWQWRWQTVAAGSGRRYAAKNSSLSQEKPDGVRWQTLRCGSSLPPCRAEQSVKSGGCDDMSTVRADETGDR